MDIKVLQGLNNQNPGSTIIIELKETIRTDIIEKIQNYHPVFMDSFKLEAKILTVNSKLPHLWVEIGKALQKFSNRDWSEDYTNKYILEEIIKRQVLSMSTIPILHTAMQEGLELTQFYVSEGLIQTLQTNRRYVIGCGYESEISTSSTSTKDSYVGFSTQREKILTNTILDRLGIMSPKWVELKSVEDIKKNWDEFKKPVVIKPNGLVGGSGVVTKIDTLDKAYKAYEYTVGIINTKERRPYQQLILMQQQIEGEDYRVLVVNGKFKIATKRIPAFVIGDGINTIEKLIEITNQDPRRDITNPTHTLKPIVIDDALTDYLKDQNLTLEYVPKKEEKVYVRKVASMSKGGITEDFTEKVHPQIKLVVESLAKSLHTYTLGIDVFCKDISKPLSADNGGILECNTMPEAYLNTYPVIGKQYTGLAKEYIDGLLDNRRTKRVVIIGKTLKEAKTNLKLNIDITNETVGLYSGNKLLINDTEINENIDTHLAFEALKLNASLTTLVHHLTVDEFMKYGSGFEKIDLVVVDSNEKEITSILKGYENIGLINKLVSI